MKEYLKKSYGKLLALLLACAVVWTGGSCLISAATKPALSCTELTLEVGQTEKLGIKNVKKNKIQEIRYQSDQKKVAKAGAKGKITGVKAGKAVITCSLTLTSGKSYILKCDVTVREKTAESGGMTEQTAGGEEQNKEGDTMKENCFYIKVGGKTLPAAFEDNSSAEAFRELLKKGDVTVSMSDYGNFEKVGKLGTTLPRNDTQITTVPGDVILYQGNSITIYYDKNSWSFTRLGRIEGATTKSMKEFLGDGSIEAVFSLKE